MSLNRPDLSDLPEVKLSQKRVVVFDDYLSTRPSTATTVRAQPDVAVSSTAYLMQATRLAPKPSLPAQPLESRPLSELILDRTKGPDVKCFHQVNQAHPKDPKRNHELYFFKHNLPGSIVSELEAMAAGVYALLAPHNIPETYAYYNEQGEHVGVASKAIPGFKSLVDDPLTSDDFCNEKLIAGLAVGLTLSHFFMEDDLHRGNLDKYGHRLDFDMSFWPIFSQFKDSGPIDWALRTPQKHSFPITEYDIRHFPNTMDAKPFYWPTHEAPIIREPLRSRIAQFIPISKNAYRVSDNNLFRNLEKHPTFIHHKFKAYLKIALTDTETYSKIAKSRVRHDRQVDGQNLIDLFSSTLAERTQATRDCLASMPEFRDFMMKHGETVLAEILTEFSEYNELVKEKAHKNQAYLDLLVHLPDVDKRYRAYFTSLFNEDEKIKTFELTDSLFGSNSLPPAASSAPTPSLHNTQANKRLSF